MSKTYLSHFLEAKRAEWKNLLDFKSLKRVDESVKDLPIRFKNETLTKYARRIGAVKLDMFFLVTQAHVERELKVKCRMYITGDLVPTEARGNVYAPTMSRLEFVILLY